MRVKLFAVSLFSISSLLLVFSSIGQGVTMQLEASDVLPASFHAGRREAFRKEMPANSVAVVFSYPERIFSKDVNYVFHQNPDMYYLSGYNEPDAVLVLFKEMQQGADGQQYNELLFVRKRDAQREQWNGRRLGVEGAREKLGFKYVYNGEDFEKFPVSFNKFSTVIYDVFPDDAHQAANKGDLQSLINVFKAKMDIPVTDNRLLQEDLVAVARAAGNPVYRDRLMTRIASRQNAEGYRDNPYIIQLLNKPDSVELEAIAASIKSKYAGVVEFGRITGVLREIKTTEELDLLRKAIHISSIAHLEAMRAITPSMSEKELEGILEYVHKKHGSEEEGYPPIVGAGQNGCILHYIENSAPQVQNQLLLADVGAEYHGYTADVTRTFPAGGKFTPEQKAIYQLVYDAQEAVFKLCKEGVPFASLNEKAKEVLANGLIELGIIKTPSEVSKYYMHGVSHFLGLDVHDKSHSRILKENMVITVEPGIYIAKGSPCDPKWWDIGVRIEDDVRIGKNDCEIMSLAAPRSVEAVEKALAEKSLFNQMSFPPLIK
jgi:Xaa-Pro aminopeptidase